MICPELVNPGETGRRWWLYRERSGRGLAGARAGAPFFGHPVEGGLNGCQSIDQAQARRIQWSAPVVGERTAHGQALRARGDGLGVRAALQLAFDRADAAYLLLEFLFGMPIGFKDEVPSLAQVVELAHL